MGRVKACLGNLALFALLGWVAGDCLGLVVAIGAGILGWVDREGWLVLLLGGSGLGTLAGAVAGIASQTPGAQARRERLRAASEIRRDRQDRDRQAARWARQRSWWGEVVLLAVLVVGGVLSHLTMFVLWVMVMMGVDDMRYLPAGLLISFVLSVPLIVRSVRFLRGGGGSSGRSGRFFGGGSDSLGDVFDGDSG